MPDKLALLHEFYTREKALVTSPFITQEGDVHRSLFKGVFDRLGLFLDQPKVLDVGCGTGLLSTLFSSQTTYVGVDLVRQPSQQQLAGDHKTFIQSDAHYIPIADGSVDLLICLDSFEHYPDQQQAAREFRRVLKPGGALFLSIPNYSNPAGWVKKWTEARGSYSPDTWAPFDFWKPQELEHFVTPGRVKELFSRAGFSHFRWIGYPREVSIGLVPWLWHPKMPGRVNSLFQRLFSPLSRPLARLFPGLSLHTFWKMT